MTLTDTRPRTRRRPSRRSARQPVKPRRPGTRWWAYVILGVVGIAALGLAAVALIQL
jgi:hypothetical protein